MALQFLSFSSLIGYPEPFPRFQREELGDRDGSTVYLSRYSTDAIIEMVREKIFTTTLQDILKHTRGSIYPVGIHALAYGMIANGVWQSPNDSNTKFGVNAAGFLSHYLITQISGACSVQGNCRDAWSSFIHTFNKAELPLTRANTQGEGAFDLDVGVEDISRASSAGLAKAFDSWYLARLSHRFISLMKLKSNSPPGTKGKNNPDKIKAFNKMVKFPLDTDPVRGDAYSLVVVDCRDFISVMAEDTFCFFTPEEFKNFAIALQAHAEMMIELAVTPSPMYPENSHKIILKGRLLIYSYMAKEGNRAMDLAKLLEALCTVFMMQRYGKVQDSDFIDNMVKATQEVLGLKNVEDVFTSPIWKYLESLPTVLLSEFCYSPNTYGSCRGEEEQGIEKQMRRMVMEAPIVPGENMSSIGGLMRDIVKSYFFKHRCLPKMGFPEEAAYDLLRSYTNGGKADKIEEAVKSGFGLSSEQWYRVDCYDMFKWRQADHFAASMEDKSVSPPARSMYQVMREKDPSAYGKLPPEEKKCIAAWLCKSGFKNEYEAFFDKLENGDMSALEGECAKLSAKERELKILCRFFTSFSPLLRHLMWVVRENFTAIAPYIPGQLSHLGESIKEETITEFSTPADPSADHVFLFINLDFEAWNLYQTYLKTTPLFEKFDKMFGTEIYSKLHEISRHIPYFFPGVRKVFLQEGANGLGEGQCQFLWTANTLGDVNRALEKLGLVAISTGSGDNCLGKIKINKTMVDEQYGGDISLAAMRIKESVCKTFSELGRVTKASESPVSDVISILLKHLDVAGTRMPMSLKYAAKRTSYASMGAGTLSSSLGGLCGSIFSVSEKSSTVIGSRTAQLFNYVFTLNDLAGISSGKMLLEVKIPQLISLMLAGNELSGLTYLPLRDVICPGHSDSVSSRIGIMQMACERVPSLEPYLHNILMSPVPKTLDVLDLARAPYSVPKLSSVSATHILREYIEKSATDSATGDEAKFYLRGANPSEKRKLSHILSAIQPRDPKMISNIFDGSIVSQAEKMLSKVMTETTMSRMGSKKDLRAVIKRMMKATDVEIIETINRSNGVYNQGGKSLRSPVLASWKENAPHSIAESLRKETWGIDEDTVTMIHPYDAMTSIIRLGTPVIQQSMDILVCTRDSSMPYIGDEMKPFYPVTKRGSYTRSTTAQKVKKGISRHPVVSPALRSLQKLLTAYTYTNRRDDSAAIAILLVAQSFVSEREFLELSKSYSRSQGLVHHRMGATGYKAEQHINSHLGLPSYMHVTSDTLAFLRETGNNYPVNIAHMLFSAKAMRLFVEMSYAVREGGLLPDNTCLVYSVDRSLYKPLKSVSYGRKAVTLTKMDKAGEQLFYSFERDQTTRSIILGDLAKEEADQQALQELEQAAYNIGGMNRVEDEYGEYTPLSLMAVQNYLRASSMLPQRGIDLPLRGQIGQAWVREAFSTQPMQKILVHFDINLSDIKAVSILDFPLLVTKYLLEGIIIPFPEGELNLVTVSKYVTESGLATSVLTALSKEIVKAPSSATLLLPFQVVSGSIWPPSAEYNENKCLEYLRRCVSENSLKMLQDFSPANLSPLPFPKTSQERQAFVAAASLIMSTIKAQLRDVIRSYRALNPGPVKSTSLIIDIMRARARSSVSPELNPCFMLIHNNLPKPASPCEGLYYLYDQDEIYKRAMSIFCRDAFSAGKLYTEGKSEYKWMVDFFARFEMDILMFTEEYLETMPEYDLGLIPDVRVFLYSAYLFFDATPILLEHLQEACAWISEQSEIVLENVDIERYRTLLKSTRTVGDEHAEALKVLSLPEQMAYIAEVGQIDALSLSRSAIQALDMLSDAEESEAEALEVLTFKDIFKVGTWKPETKFPEAEVVNIGLSRLSSEVADTKSLMLIDDSEGLTPYDQDTIRARGVWAMKGRVTGNAQWLKSTSPSQLTRYAFAYSSTAAKLYEILYMFSILELPHRGNMRHSILCFADGYGGFGCISAMMFPSAYVYISRLGDSIPVAHMERSSIASLLPEYIQRRIRRIGDPATFMDLKKYALVQRAEAIKEGLLEPCFLITFDPELFYDGSQIDYDRALSHMLLNAFLLSEALLSPDGIMIFKLPLDFGSSTLSILSAITGNTSVCRVIRPGSSHLGNRECYLVMKDLRFSSSEMRDHFHSLSREMEAKRFTQGEPGGFYMRQTRGVLENVMLPLGKLRSDIEDYEEKVMSSDDESLKTVDNLTTNPFYGYLGHPDSLQTVLSTIPNLLPGTEMIEYQDVCMFKMDIILQVLNDYGKKMKATLHNDYKAFRKAILRHSGIDPSDKAAKQQFNFREGEKEYAEWLKGLRKDVDNSKYVSSLSRAGHTVPSRVAELLFYQLMSQLMAQILYSIVASYEDWSMGGVGVPISKTVFDCCTKVLNSSQVKTGRISSSLAFGAAEVGGSHILNPPDKLYISIGDKDFSFGSRYMVYIQTSLRLAGMSLGLKHGSLPDPQGNLDPPDDVSSIGILQDLGDILKPGEEDHKTFSSNYQKLKVLAGIQEPQEDPDGIEGLIEYEEPGDNANAYDIEFD